MTVNEVCTYFDLSEIVDTKVEIDREYYSTVGDVYSDGEVKSHVTREGYIHITSVQDATYLIFVDRERHTCLCVYRYIPDITCKYIMENLHILKTKLGTMDEPNNDENIINNHVDDDVININEFTCNECDFKEKAVFIRSKTNPEALEYKCTKCGTEYTFVPSKYYKLASKRIIYCKSEKSSRQINISEPNTKEK